MTNPEVIGALGSAYAKNGTYEKAIETLEHALKLNPNEILKTKIEKNLRVMRIEEQMGE